MRPLVSIVIGSLMIAQTAWSCGDKYLVRCIVNRSEAQAASHGESGRIVIIDDGAPTTKRLVSLELPAELTARGYKVYVVHDRKQLSEVVADARLDLAIVDWERVDTYDAMLTRGTPILPVIDKEAAGQLPALREKYATILKVPGTKSTSLATVDIAVHDARKSL